MADTAADLLGNSLTAQMLSQEFPERDVQQWATWLQNNRNRSRSVPYRIPFVRMAGGIFYERADLDEFIRWERARKVGEVKLSARAAEALQAFGVGEAGGSATGRKFNYSSCSGQIDESDHSAFVQLVVTDPLRVYRLSVDQAEAIARDLANEARDARELHSRSTGGTQ